MTDLVEPGVIKTDFAGRSFDFSNDESLTEYQQAVGKLFAAMESLGAGASESSVVAEVIYQAATDDSARLRYTAGEDAMQLIEERHAVGDEAFVSGRRALFGF